MNPDMNASIEPFMNDITAPVAALFESTVQKRVAAASALGDSKNPAAVSPLIRSLADPHAKVRQESARALGRLDDAEAVPALISALRDPEPAVRTAVIAAIGRIRDRRATGALVSCLEDPDERVRIGAAEVLGRLGDPRAIGPLEVLARDRFAGVRDAAEHAAGRLRKKGHLPGNTSCYPGLRKPALPPPLFFYLIPAPLLVHNHEVRPMPEKPSLTEFITNFFLLFLSSCI